MTRKASDATKNMQLYDVRFFHPRSSCMTNILVDVQGITLMHPVWRSRAEEPNNLLYSAASLALQVIFLSFVVVELIQFFHGALQLLLLLLLYITPG